MGSGTNRAFLFRMLSELQDGPSVCRPLLDARSWVTVLGACSGDSPASGAEGSEGPLVLESLSRDNHLLQLFLGT